MPKVKADRLELKKTWITELGVGKTIQLEGSQFYCQVSKGSSSSTAEIPQN
jgi:hypothetical protein